MLRWVKASECWEAYNVLWTLGKAYGPLLHASSYGTKGSRRKVLTRDKGVKMNKDAHMVQLYVQWIRKSGLVRGNCMCIQPRLSANEARSTQARWQGIKLGKIQTSHENKSNKWRVRYKCKIQSNSQTEDCTWIRTTWHSLQLFPYILLCHMVIYDTHWWVTQKGELAGMSGQSDNWQGSWSCGKVEVSGVQGESWEIG